MGIEMVYLRLSPVYWGFGIPAGDGSAVVVIPAFLMTDLYLTEFRSWINRIGYKAYYSGIGMNAECPNLLIQYKLSADDREGLQGNRPKGPPGGTQPGRRHRSRDGSADARPDCFGHYAGIAVSRCVGAPFDSARRPVGARTDSGTSWRRRVAGLLYGGLHVQFPGIAGGQTAEVRVRRPRSIRSPMESWTGKSAGPAIRRWISKFRRPTSGWPSIRSSSMWWLTAWPARLRVGAIGRSGRHAGASTERRQARRPVLPIQHSNPAQ